MNASTSLIVCGERCPTDVPQIQKSCVRMTPYLVQGLNTKFLSQTLKKLIRSLISVVLNIN